MGGCFELFSYTFALVISVFTWVSLLAACCSNKKKQSDPLKPQPPTGQFQTQKDSQVLQDLHDVKTQEGQIVGDPVPENNQPGETKDKNFSSSSSSTQPHAEPKYYGTRPLRKPRRRRWRKPKIVSETETSSSSWYESCAEEEEEEPPAEEEPAPTEEEPPAEEEPLTEEEHPPEQEQPPEEKPPAEEEPPAEEKADEPVVHYGYYCDGCEGTFGIIYKTRDHSEIGEKDERKIAVCPGDAKNKEHFLVREVGNS